MRSIWKGSINFGLVNIPVAVFPATRSESISFKQLRKSDLSPIRYKKVAEADEKEVPAEEIVKGYEHSKGNYLVLSDEDFERVRIESTHSIEITDFVEQAQINPKFFYKPYFLEPQKGGERGYSLLHRALVETSKVGIAKVAIKSREYLAAVKPDGLFLVLELMHFAQEVLDPGTLKSAAAEVPERELAMAKQLIGAMTSDWQPEKYQDQYQTALLEMIEEKLQNKPAAPATPRIKEPMVGDILAILQQSLQKTSARQEKAPRTGRVSSAAALVKRSRRPAGKLHSQ